MTREKSVLVIPDKSKLAEVYAATVKDYEKALSVFVEDLSRLLSQAGLRPTIKSRVKQFESYYSKRLRLLKNAWMESGIASPVNDMLAVRVVCPFLGDLAVAENAMKEAFSIEEIERKGAERSFREFGYESIHVLVKIPKELEPLCKNLDRAVIEVQLRTILQEAWAEVEHELVYKAEFTPFDEPMKRKLAALNANLTLSDIIFQEILEYQKRLNTELAKRRQAFYHKIEEVSEPELAGSKKKTTQKESDEEVQRSNQSAESKFELENFKSFGMDGLLLAALEAHNNADFDKAEQIYSEIILKKPEKEILAVVYKHRGMAYFAQSQYKEALRDFSACLILDPECYKALYYRGVVRSILEDHSSAIDDYSSALKIHPYHFFSRYRRALSYWKLGDLAQALADCEIALRIEPDNSLARHLLNQIKGEISQTDF